MTLEYYIEINLILRLLVSRTQGGAMNIQICIYTHRKLTLMYHLLVTIKMACQFRDADTISTRFVYA